MASMSLLGVGPAAFDQTATLAEDAPAVCARPRLRRPPSGFLGIVAAEQVVGVFEVLLQRHGDVAQFVEAAPDLLGRELRR
jgi:hypothetical protein